MASSTPHLGAYRNLTDKFMKYRERYRSGSGLGALPLAIVTRAAALRLPFARLLAARLPHRAKIAVLTSLARRLSGFGGAPSAPARLRPRVCSRRPSAAAAAWASATRAPASRASPPPSPRVGRFQRGGDERHSAHPRETQGAQAAHAKALLPNFDDMGTDDHVVEVVTQETTRLFKRCEARLQRLGAGIERRSPTTSGW